MLRLVLEIDCQELRWPDCKAIELIESRLLEQFERTEQDPKSLPIVYIHRVTHGTFQEPLMTVRIVEAKRFLNP